MLEPALVGHLKADAVLNALIDGRIYPLRLPDPPALPAIVYQRVSAVRSAAHDGPPGFVGARVQFNIWAESYVTVKQISAALRKALLGYSGAMDGLRAVVPAQESEIDLHEPDSGLYRISADYRIWYEEE